MMKLNVILKVIIYVSLAFLIIAIFSLTIGQIIPVEFENWKLMHKYYDLIFEGLPISIIFTLTGTLKKHGSIARNSGVVGLTIAGAILSFYLFAILSFQIGFGAWVTEVILYENRDRPSIKIIEQRYDVGALGYGGNRVVKVKPFLYYWQIVTNIDTTRIVASQWNYSGEPEEMFKE